MRSQRMRGTKAGFMLAAVAGAIAGLGWIASGEEVLARGFAALTGRAVEVAQREALAAEIRERYTKQEYRIPMRDGAKLLTSVYAPKDASPAKTYPFLIERTPYSIAPYGVDNYPKELGPAPSFVRDGFIFVYQDV